MAQLADMTKVFGPLDERCRHVTSPLYPIGDRDLWWVYMADGLIGGLNAFEILLPLLTRWRLATPGVPVPRAWGSLLGTAASLQCFNYKHHAVTIEQRKLLLDVVRWICGEPGADPPKLDDIARHAQLSDVKAALSGQLVCTCSSSYVLPPSVIPTIPAYAAPHHSWYPCCLLVQISIEREAWHRQCARRRWTVSKSGPRAGFTTMLGNPAGFHVTAGDAETERTAVIVARNKKETSGEFDGLQHCIAERADAQFALQCHAAAAYKFGGDDGTQVKVAVEVDRAREPLLRLDSMLLYNDVGAPPEWPLEPAYDESSGSDSDADESPQQAAARVMASDQKRAREDAKASPPDQRGVVHATRRVYAGGRYNFTGTPRGTLYRDRPLPKSCRSGWGFGVLGGLLRHDRHPLRKAGAFTSAMFASVCTPITQDVWPLTLTAGWCFRRLWR